MRRWLLVVATILLCLLGLWTGGCDCGYSRHGSDAGADAGADAADSGSGAPAVGWEVVPGSERELFTAEQELAGAPVSLDRLGGSFGLLWADEGTVRLSRFTSEEGTFEQTVEASGPDPRSTSRLVAAGAGHVAVWADTRAGEAESRLGRLPVTSSGARSIA